MPVTPTYPRRLHRGGAERRPPDHGRRHLDHRVRRLRAARPDERAERSFRASPSSSASSAGSSAASTMSYAVQQFFQNGGSDALIVRTAHLAGGGTGRRRAASHVGGRAARRSRCEAGKRGRVVRAVCCVRIDHETEGQGAGRRRCSTSRSRTLARGVIETLRNLAARHVAGPADRAAVVAGAGDQRRRPTGRTSTPTSAGSDPFDPMPRDALHGRCRPAWTATRPRPTSSRRATTHRDASRSRGPTSSTCSASRRSCRRAATTDGSGPAVGREGPARRVLRRPPRVVHRRPAIPTGPARGDHDRRYELDTYVTGIASDDRKNAALYFPRLRGRRPAAGRRRSPTFAPCGAVAGIMARTDAYARRVEGAGGHRRRRSRGVQAADRRS